MVFYKTMHSFFILFLMAVSPAAGASQAEIKALNAAKYKYRTTMEKLTDPRVKASIALSSIVELYNNLNTELARLIEEKKVNQAMLESMIDLSVKYRDLALSTTYDLDKTSQFYVFGQTEMEAFYNVVISLAQSLANCSTQPADICQLSPFVEALQEKLGSFSVNGRFQENITAAADERETKYLTFLGGQFHGSQMIAKFNLHPLYFFYIRLIKEIIDLSLAKGDHTIFKEIINVHSAMYALGKSCSYGTVLNKNTITSAYYKFNHDRVRGTLLTFNHFEAKLEKTCGAGTDEKTTLICSLIQPLVHAIFNIFNKDLKVMNDSTDILHIDNKYLNDVARIVRSIDTRSDRSQTIRSQREPKKIVTYPMRQTKTTIKGFYFNKSNLIHQYLRGTRLYPYSVRLYRYFYRSFLRARKENPLSLWFDRFHPAYMKFMSSIKPSTKSKKAISYNPSDLEEVVDLLKSFNSEVVPFLSDQPDGQEIIKNFIEIVSILKDLKKGNYEEVTVVQEFIAPEEVEEDEEDEEPNVQLNRGESQKEEFESEFDDFLEEEKPTLKSSMSLRQVQDLNEEGNFALKMMSEKIPRGKVEIKQNLGTKEKMPVTNPFDAFLDEIEFKPAVRKNDIKVNVVEKEKPNVIFQVSNDHFDKGNTAKNIIQKPIITGKKNINIVGPFEEDIGELEKNNVITKEIKPIIDFNEDKITPKAKGGKTNFVKKPENLKEIQKQPNKNIIKDIHQPIIEKNPSTSKPATQLTTGVVTKNLDSPQIKKINIPKPIVKEKFEYDPYMEDDTFKQDFSKYNEHDFYDFGEPSKNVIKNEIQNIPTETNKNPNIAEKTIHNQNQPTIITDNNKPSDIIQKNIPEKEKNSIFPVIKEQSETKTQTQTNPNVKQNDKTTSQNDIPSIAKGTIPFQFDNTIRNIIGPNGKIIKPKNFDNDFEFTDINNPINNYDLSHEILHFQGQDEPRKDDKILNPNTQQTTKKNEPNQKIPEIIQNKDFSKKPSIPVYDYDPKFDNWGYLRDDINQPKIFEKAFPEKNSKDKSPKTIEITEVKINQPSGQTEKSPIIPPITDEKQTQITKIDQPILTQPDEIDQIKNPKTDKKNENIVDKVTGFITPIIENIQNPLKIIEHPTKTKDEQKKEDDLEKKTKKQQTKLKIPPNKFEENLFGDYFQPFFEETEFDPTKPAVIQHTNLKTQQNTNNIPKEEKQPIDINGFRKKNNVPIYDAKSPTDIDEDIQKNLPNLGKQNFEIKTLGPDQKIDTNVGKYVPVDIDLNNFHIRNNPSRFDPKKPIKTNFDDLNIPISKGPGIQIKTDKIIGSPEEKNIPKHEVKEDADEPFNSNKKVNLGPTQPDLENEDSSSARIEGVQQIKTPILKSTDEDEFNPKINKLLDITPKNIPSIVEQNDTPQTTTINPVETKDHDITTENKESNIHKNIPTIEEGTPETIGQIEKNPQKIPSLHTNDIDIKQPPTLARLGSKEHHPQTIQQNKDLINLPSITEEDTSTLTDSNERKQIKKPTFNPNKVDSHFPPSIKKLGSKEREELVDIEELKRFLNDVSPITEENPSTDVDSDRTKVQVKLPVINPNEIDIKYPETLTRMGTHEHVSPLDKDEKGDLILNMPPVKEEDSSSTITKSSKVGKPLKKRTVVLLEFLDCFDCLEDKFFSSFRKKIYQPQSIWSN